MIRKYSITSILDLGCGDNTWMSRVDLTGVHYRGVDISPYLIRTLAEPVRKQAFADSTHAAKGGRESERVSEW